MRKVDQKTLALLLRRAGIPATKRRLAALIGPADFIDQAGERLTRPETAKLSPVDPLWRRKRG
ncbi:MAG TPA: hypothetical protein VED46_02295 [Alphaproteobacteria bacterium]|nr:hypothetical protein [Alphaproteobacteria bacterium]